jgi:pimeloyl-ACP methyl ester carboxylesterase
VRALVYVAALAPDEGETVGEAFGRGTPHPDAFAQHASPEEQTLLRAVQRPISVSCITTRVGRPRWKDLPTWYLIAEQDRMIPAENQRFMADRMGASTRAYPVDHTPLVTAPTVVTDLILEAVTQAKADMRLA